MNNKIYSPILKSTQAAFVYQGPYIIYFSYPQFIDKSLIKHMQIRITNQQDSKSLVSTSNFPDGIYYTSEFSVEGSISIPFGTLVTPPHAGGIYKVQLRFGYCDLFTNLSQFTSWKTAAIQNGDFSEWSTVMAIKCISTPQLSFLNIANNGIFNTLRPSFTAQALFADSDEEYTDLFEFSIYDSVKNFIASSGWQQHLEGKYSVDTYAFDLILQEDTTYFATYHIISNNGYENSTTISFEVSDNYFASLHNVNFSIDELDNENGMIKLLVRGVDETLAGKYVITRADETSDFEKWEDLYAYFATGVEAFTFIDYTVRDGISYKYAIQLENAFGNRTAPLYADEGEPSLIYLEHSYLVGEKGRQLKLMFNVQVNSFKHTILASKQDTLGSKYPTILRNGVAYYAEFPISGLISVKMDDINSFAQFDSSIAPNDLSYKNINIEQLFREKVEEFLNDGKPKLFRSATEGNFLVVLMNVSLTPQTAVNRMLYQFSANAYEVAPCTFDKLREYGILVAPSDVVIPEDGKMLSDILGDTIKGPLSNFNLFKHLQKEVAKLTNDNYKAELVSIDTLEIYSGDMSASFALGSDKTITIPAYKRYYYLEPIKEDALISAQSKLSFLNYTYTYQLIPQDKVKVVEYGKKKIFGQAKNALNAENRIIELERFILQDMLKESGGTIQTDENSNLIIKNNNLEYRINKIYDLIITAAPNQSLGSIVINETGYYRLTKLDVEEISNLQVDLSKEFAVDYSCSIDWVKR